MRRSWNAQVLQDAQWIEVSGRVSHAASRFYYERLPRLTSISLKQTESVFRLHSLQQLTSIVIRDSEVPDLLPLSALPNLRRLQLDDVNLGPLPCFFELTQLRQLAVSSCCEEGGGLFDAISLLNDSGRLEQLELNAASLPDEIILRVILHSENEIRSLLLSAPCGGPAPHWDYFKRLKVLALMSLNDPCQDEIMKLTGLEALSLAGYLDSGDTPGLAIEDFAAMRMLRVLDIRWAAHPACLKTQLQFLSHSSSKLRLIAMDTGTADSSTSAAWPILCQADLADLPSRAPEHSGVCMKESLNRHQIKRLRSSMLYNAAMPGSAGRDLTYEAIVVDLERMCLFDSFWFTH
ncbi:hypothetical protein WJX73_007802 [Symbiochloris irregularis]|uniref:Uncharacterized protein n=1 Tax=Symbiochloris irregularis TaxID=706552 RepID=A0AAW1NXM8_9CHLO